ncbi:MAG: hypothetical protein HY203_10405 [Nitrospirae bacterium]|nr:hypothetical protein [Nitrospirota bacterium]
MSETLIGVIVGGVIASITTIASLIINDRRWRREMRHEYLKGERQRFEKMYSTTLDQLGGAMRKQSYPTQMYTDFMILMPKNIHECFKQWLDEKDKNEDKRSFKYFELSALMKSHLAEIDEQIKNF